MKPKWTSSIFFAFITCLFFASSTWGAFAILINDDGTSINGIVDGSQLIHIKAQSGTQALKLNDIFWSAGENATKRFRVVKRRNLIVGEVDDKDEIKIRKDEKELTILFKSIVFLLIIKDEEKFEEEKYLKDSAAVRLLEHTGGPPKLSLFKVTIPGTMSILLPEYWEGDITISNPNYPTKVRKQYSFDISFDIEGGEDYKKPYDTVDSLGMFYFFEAKWKGSSKPVISFPTPKLLSKERFLPIPNEHKYTVTHTIHVPFDISGEGYFYLYLTDSKKISPDVPKYLQYTEFLKTSLGIKNGPHVMVYRTVSNVLRLPITIEKR